MKTSIMRFEAARIENIATLVGGARPPVVPPPQKPKGNNGFGNGGGDGVPGNSGKSDENR